MTTPKFQFPEEPESKSKRKCLYCGGTDLIRGVTALDWNQGAERPLQVGKDRKPDALLFKGRERSGTTTVVCGNCGFVHLFATCPAVLKQA